MRGHVACRLPEPAGSAMSRESSERTAVGSLVAGTLLLERYRLVRPLARGGGRRAAEPGGGQGVGIFKNIIRPILPGHSRSRQVDQGRYTAKSG